MYTIIFYAMGHPKILFITLVQLIYCLKYSSASFNLYLSPQELQRLLGNVNNKILINYTFTITILHTYLYMYFLIKNEISNCNSSRIILFIYALNSTLPGFYIRNTAALRVPHQN